MVFQIYTQEWNYCWIIWASQIAQLVKNLPAMQEIPGLGRSAGEGRGYPLLYSWASLVAQLVKNLPAMQETWVLSLGWKDPLEKGKATHSSILAWRISMDRGAWRATVHGVAKSRTRLSDFTFTFHFHTLEKEMATHSSVLAWRIPGTGEPGGLPSMGSHRVGHD